MSGTKWIPVVLICVFFSGGTVSVVKLADNFKQADVLLIERNYPDALSRHQAVINSPPANDRILEDYPSVVFLTTAGTLSAPSAEASA